MLALKKFSVILRGNAGLAQLVEQRIRNAWVGRSNLLTGTNKKSALKGAVFLLVIGRGEERPTGVGIE